MKIQKAVIYYDLREPKNPGWAYSVATASEYLSGPLDATRDVDHGGRQTPPEELLDELVGIVSQVPRYGWRRCDDGNGWVYGR